jgi:CheY-like chemotaxis protein
MKTPEPKPIAAAEPAVNERVVLVVDDALETLRMLCDALDAEGYTVLVARDAVEALQRFEITVPDAVLLDAVMALRSAGSSRRRRPGRTCQ